MADKSVEAPRDRIIRLAREIEQDSRKGSLEPKQFFQRFIERVVAAVGARAGAVWMLNDRQQIELLCETGLERTGYHQNPSAPARNQRLLAEVLSHGQACAIAPAEAPPDKLPTEDLLIMAALVRERRCIGVVQVFQRANVPPQARPGYLQFVEQMCGYASTFLEGKARGDEEPTMTAELAEQFEQFLAQIHRSLDVAEVAAVAANDGRLILDCDRLSVAVQYGPKSVVTAISGQDFVNQRSNLVRALTALTRKVVELDETLLYVGKETGIRDEYKEPLARYIQESGSRMVVIAPLYGPGESARTRGVFEALKRRLQTPPVTATPPKAKLPDDGSEPAAMGDSSAADRRDAAKTGMPEAAPGDRTDAAGPDTERPSRAIGALILEQIAESRPKPGMFARAALLAPHIAQAVANARTHQRVFLMRFWQWLWRRLAWFEGKNWYKAGAVAVLLAALVGWMVFVPHDYPVVATGRLMPAVSYEVFAPEDGEVVEIFVRTKQRVQPGDPLLRIRNDALRAELLALRNRLNELRLESLVIKADLEDAIRRADRGESIRLQEKWVETQIKIRGTDERRKLFQQRVDALTVRAPAAGVVATFQLKQSLLNRPVRRGESLLEIKDDSGPWRLELDVEERRMWHIQHAQKERGDSHLPVEFVLATDPVTTYQGRLERFASRAVPNEDGIRVVETFVDVDEQALPQRRIGADVRARILCGQTSWGYYFFGDVIEFVQKKFWWGRLSAEEDALPVEPARARR
ncbi:MAG: HlyD family efflux transporter periplasmic adaptor subunit [Planctomycetota bacterium]|nr:MAG: HlyD family efflux transporter periplasmic adaptor subunit [Planctomycetota bacterium]